MLRKLATIFLAFLYLTMSGGMIVSAHYCMGELADISFGHDSAEKCDDCGMDNHGCCHDVVKVCRITDAHAAAAGQAAVDLSTPADMPPIAFRCVKAAINGSLQSTIIPDPPEPDGVSLSVRNCVFRI